MANVLLNIEKGVEVAASDALHFIAGVNAKSPAAIAALGVLLGAVAKVVSEVSNDAQAPASLLNFSLDVSQFADIKAVWPDVVKLASSLGIKL